MTNHVTGTNVGMMTEQEAIAWLEDERKRLSDSNYEKAECFVELLTVAIEALQKQIPTHPEEKVRQEYSNLGKEYYCQRCGAMFPFWHHENGRASYCGNCGQKLLEEKNDTTIHHRRNETDAERHQATLLQAPR